MFEQLNCTVQTDMAKQYQASAGAVYKLWTQYWHILSSRVATVLTNGFFCLQSSVCCPLTPATLFNSSVLNAQLYLEAS